MSDAGICRDADCKQRHCLCSCGRHLDPLDQTCIHCLGATRRWLRTIPDLAAHIIDQLDGYPAASPGISERTSRNADLPLFGGDRTALVGPGGDGRNASSHPHAADNQPTDPPSVVAELESWERDWRETMRLPAALTVATLTNVTGFLLDNLGWAANHHPAFDDFHNEVRQLHQALEHAAGASERPVDGLVACFDCPGVRLRRLWLPDGLDDLWQCPHCKRRYLASEYWLAVRQQHERATEAVTQSEACQTS